MHIGIILLLGGIILVPGVVPKAPFVGEMITPSALEEPQDSLDPLIAEDALPLELPSLDMPDLPASEAPSEQTFDIIAATSIPSSAFVTPTGPVVVSTINTQTFASGGGGTSPLGGRKGSLMQRLFGSSEAIEGDLQGTFYDLKQRRSGGATGEDNTDAYHRAINQFAGRGPLRPQVFSGYFQAPGKLYASQFFFPLMSAAAGPAFFKVDELVQPMFWVIHYTGKAKAPFDGRFRFIGRGGEVLLVHWNGKLVLDACHSWMRGGTNPSSSWQPRQNVGKYRAFNSGMWANTETLVFGDWIEARKDVVVNVDVIIGERAGGDFYCFLMWEGPGAQGKLDPETNLMSFPIWTTNFGRAEIPTYTPGREGPPVLQP